MVATPAAVAAGVVVEGVASELSSGESAAQAATKSVSTASEPTVIKADAEARLQMPDSRFT
jgi:hypothetical protein